MDLFNVITWSMEEGVCTVDAEGRLTYLNPAAEKALGWTAPEIVGREMHEVVHPTAAGGCQVVECPLDGGFRSGRRISGETYCVRKDATSFPASFNLAPLGRAPGDVTGALMVFTDVSDHKQHEEHLRRTRENSERLEALEHTKSQFLNLASHELRGPLSVVRGYVSMIEDGTLGNVTPEVKSVLPIVSSKLRQMDLLVNDMLETARLEDSRMQLDLEPLDLRDAVRRAVESLEPIDSERHNVALRLPSQPVMVVADVMRVGNILSNLIDNAIKYSPDGGEVVSTVSSRDGMAMVSVRDPGIGIAQQDMDTLFTRFGRVVTKHNRHIPGTGLGLYLSRELARLHGGDLTVVSSPGLGSTFTLTLPAAPDAA
jgi:PAS domain S-box-containing protein